MPGLRIEMHSTLIPPLAAYHGFTAKEVREPEICGESF